MSFRSQGGPLSGLPSNHGLLLAATSPSSSSVFSLLPVWPSSRLPWALGRRGFALESDTTLVSLLCADDEPDRRWSGENGAAWKQLDAAKGELTPSILATWVVPSWLSLQERSAAGSQLRLLAKTWSIPEPLCARARQSWAHRWGSTLACVAARAFASSLLDRRGLPVADGDILSEADFLGDFCRAPSAK